MKRPCLDCGTPSTETRCQRCGDTFNRKRNRQATLRRQTTGGSPYDQGAYRTVAKLVRLNATKCHICKQGPKENDPWQADHIIPVAQGGGAGPLAPAHRSCNIARANKLRGNTPHDIANLKPARQTNPTTQPPTTTSTQNNQQTSTQTNHTPTDGRGLDPYPVYN